MKYMNDTVAVIMAELDVAADDDYFSDISYEVVEKIKQTADPSAFLEPVVCFIEEHPQVDLGCPGALVHFVESYYRKGYEQLLAQSVQRRPTAHSLWMLNRIINDVSNPDRGAYIALMRNSAERDDIGGEAKEAAAQYVKHIDGQ